MKAACSKITVLACLLALLVASAKCKENQASSTPSQGPSVLFILLDDLGAADLSFNAKRLGQVPAIPTPNIDALANEAVVLENYYTHPLCGPTRCALVTGRTANSMGNPFPTLNGGGLDRKYNTIADEFKARDYSTHFVGKWGIDYPDPHPRDPNRTELVVMINGVGVKNGLGPGERGYDSFYGLYGSAHNHFTKEWVHTGNVDWHSHNATQELDYPQLDEEPDEYSTHIFTREARRVIRGWSKESPGYLHLSYTAPHDPLQAPEEYHSENTPCGKIENERRRIYCGMVRAIDEGVGQLVDQLKMSGIFEDTIIVLASDNGGAPSVGGMNYPFRGQKATVYNGGIRVPAFVKIPSSIQEGTKGHHAVMLHVADWAPTLLALVDVARNSTPSFKLLGDDIDGVDQSQPLLNRKPKGKEVATSQRSTVYEYNVVMDHAVIVEGEWKLLLGNAGRRDRFREPHSKWYDSEERTFYQVEETLADVADWFLGPNGFSFIWGMSAYLDAIANRLSGNAGAMRMREILENHDYGDRIPIPAGFPKVEWSEFELDRVQLYHVPTDPYEDNNVALENPELVESLAAKVREHVRGGAPHHMSQQKRLYDYMMEMGQKMVIGLVVSLFVVLAAAMYFCRSRKGNSHSKRKQSPAGKLKKSQKHQ